jgi:hypothetical protein
MVSLLLPLESSFVNTMKYLLFAKLWLLSTVLFAQSGNYFLSHYTPASERADRVCFDLEQDSRGVMYFATNEGILKFDGEEWETIKSDGAIYSVLITAQGKTYWSGITGYGTLETGTDGHDHIRHLSDKDADVFQSIAINQHVYFVNERSIFFIDQSEKRTVINATEATGAFTGLFQLYNAAYVTTEQGGIFKVATNKLEATTLLLPSEVHIVTTASLEGNDDYLLASNNRIYQCSAGNSLREVKLQDQGYADANVAVTLTRVNNHLIALGTLRGGVFFVDPITGKTQEIVNYDTGLPDNEVFGTFRDSNQSVWVAHDYGFTRIAPYLPFRSFSHYPGLSGNLLCALSFNGQVYVGTTLGLFKLVKEDIYDEVVTYVDVEVRAKPGKLKPVTPAAESQTEPESKKKGFFRFLRKRRDEPETANSKNKTAAKPSTKTTQAKPGVQYRKEKRVQRMLRSSQYAFRKVEGIRAKISQLMEYQHKLIAAGLGGLYEVTDLKATSIVDEPVRFAFHYKSKSLLVASTYDDKLWAVDFGITWNDPTIFAAIDDPVDFIFEGKKDELWLSALEHVYRLDLKGNEVTHVESIPVDNNNLERTVGLSLNNQVILVNVNGFFQFDRARGALVKVDTVTAPRSYFAGDNLWYRDGHRWHVLGPSRQQSNLQLLNLFPDLRFMSTDQTSDNLWLVNRNNELYKFYGEKITPYERTYPVYLKSIVNGDERLRYSTDVEINEDKPLSFVVIQPDYSGFNGIEYRYMLKGLSKEWSDWSNINNEVNFPYLPPGDYQLQVQSKNMFGKVSVMNEVAFEVLPPYWKRWWFYALEFALFAGLMALSYRLSTRYRIISHLLSLITIILLIEFIQTVAGATFSQSSPVIDFFIQVLVALLVLPVETYLRNVMLRAARPTDLPRIFPAKANVKQTDKG